MLWLFSSSPPPHQHNLNRVLQMGEVYNVIINIPLLNDTS